MFTCDSDKLSCTKLYGGIVILSVVSTILLFVFIILYTLFRQPNTQYRSPFFYTILFIYFCMITFIWLLFSSFMLSIDTESYGYFIVSIITLITTIVYYRYFVHRSYNLEDREIIV